MDAVNEPASTNTLVQRPGGAGIASATHPLTAEAAAAILRQGGNAFDAAAAAIFTMQVVEPAQAGPLGEAILLLRPSDRPVIALCAQGPAPAAATIPLFRSLGLDLVPGTGLLTAPVPGAFGGIVEMLLQHGTMRLRPLVENAAALAESGFPLSLRAATNIRVMRPIFRTEWSSSAVVYLPDGQSPRPRTPFRNLALAAFWRRLLAEAESGADGSREAELMRARDAFYAGFVAEAIERFCRTNEAMDTSGRRHAGLLRGDDMARWRPSMEPAISRRTGGWTVHKPGAVTQGMVLLQTLAMAEIVGCDPAEPVGSRFIHVVTEAAKLALADREAWVGDPGFVDVPMQGLLADAYLARRARLITDLASEEHRPGSPEGRRARMPRHVEAERQPAQVWQGRNFGGPGETLPNGATLANTSQINIVDRWGNLVAATPSGGWLQGSPVIPELGAPLSNRLQHCWLDPDAPNALAGGKVPRTTLSPTIAISDRGDLLAFGTPGNDQQDVWNATFFLRYVQGGMDLGQALRAPTFHTRHIFGAVWPKQAEPGSLYLEAGVPERVVAELRMRSHRITAIPDWSEARVCAVHRHPDGTLVAGFGLRGGEGGAAAT